MRIKIVISVILIAAIGIVIALYKAGLIGNSTRVSVIEETPNIVEAVLQIQELCTEYYYDEVMVRDSVLKTGAARTLSNVANTVASAGNFFSNIFTSSDTKTSEQSTKKQAVSLLDKELVVIVKVTCRVGYDLREILANDEMQVNGDTLFITLPEAKFLETIVNPTHLDIFAESGSWEFPTELQEVTEYAKKTVVARAINDNILEKADQSGRKILQSLFSTMGFKVIFTNSNKSEQDTLSSTY